MYALTHIAFPIQGMLISNSHPTDFMGKSIVLALVVSTELYTRLQKKSLRIA
jgi:hypothetical protein